MRLKFFNVDLKTAKWTFGDIFNAIYHMQIDILTVYLFGTDLYFITYKISYQLSQGTVGFAAPLVMKVFSDMTCLAGILMFESLIYVFKNIFSSLMLYISARASINSCFNLLFSISKYSI